MIGLLKRVHWDSVKGPVLFISGMLVGVLLVAIIYFICQWKKAHDKEEKEKEEARAEAEYAAQCAAMAELDPENGNYPSAIIVEDPQGDYLFEDKSQLGQIIDFKRAPRRAEDRQSARRELVITMLIAESMSK